MIPADKYGHAGVGAILGLSTLWLGWFGVLPVILFAACKEAWDHSHPPAHAEMADFVATLIGGILSIGLIGLHRAFPTLGL